MPCVQAQRMLNWVRVHSLEAILLVPRRPASPLTPLPAHIRAFEFRRSQSCATFRAAQGGLDDVLPAGKALIVALVLTVHRIVRRRSDVHPNRSGGHDGHDHASQLGAPDPPTR